MLTIYHNPRCSKSRNTLKLIEASETPVEVIKYLEHPPSVDTLVTVHKKLGVPVSQMLRNKESLFKELGLNLNDERSHEAWFEIVHENPILLERPIVVSETSAIIGRPPENVQALLNP